jgi:hypothetical protein
LANSSSTRARRALVVGDVPELADVRLDLSAAAPRSPLTGAASHQ